MTNLSINPRGLENSAPSLSMDALSEQVQEYIQAVVSVYQCPQDMVIASAFAVAGAAVGTRLTIEDGKYRNYPCLWVCIVAPSGTNKSTPMRLLLQPLKDVDARAYKEFRKDLKLWKAAGDDKADRPIFRQHIISDCTPEARTQILMFNPHGVILSMDELRTFIDNFCRYNKSGELTQLLSINDHDTLTVNRKGDDPVLINSPYMAMLGSIQPSILADTFGNTLMMGSGFNQRWLFVYPNATPLPMYSEETLQETIANNWGVGIKNLLMHDFSVDGGKMYLRGEAKQVYVDFYNKLQSLKTDADDYMSSVYSKMQIYAIRWAGITHILGKNSLLENGRFIPDITPEEMDYSCRCMEYFIWCAEKVYSKLMEGRRNTRTEQLNKEQLIAMCYNSCAPKSKQAFADAIGVSRPFVSRAVNKYPLLRCYGYGSILNADNKGDIDDSSVTQ